MPVPGRPGAGTAARQLVEQMRRDRLFVHAGNLAFRGVFAMFPALLGLLWALEALGRGELAGSVLKLANMLLPGLAVQTIEQQITAAPDDARQGALTLGAAVTLGVALFSLSSAVRAAIDALNMMYAVEDSRPLWRRYLLSVGLSLAVAALLAGALLVLLYGARAGEQAGSEWQRWVWRIGQWPVLLLLVLTAFGLMYYAAPDVQQRVRWIQTGTVAAVVAWLMFALGLSLYSSRFSGFAQSYGALAGVAVLMVFAYGSALILLLGAEINQVLEFHDPDGKEEGERIPGDGMAGAAPHANGAQASR